MNELQLLKINNLKSLHIINNTYIIFLYLICIQKLTNY